MNPDNALASKFEKLGVRLKVRTAANPLTRGDFRLNVGHDQKGEYFDLQVFRDDVEFSVIDVRPHDRHLLLLAKMPDNTSKTTREIKTKLLCGHDERHWFVADVHGSSITVEDAKERLKPQIVRETQNRLQVKPKERNRRKNPGFIRQGEWFFIPAPNMNPDKMLVLKNEPLRRGGGKPHMVEFLYRTGGTTVYVNLRYPNGLSQESYNNLLKRDANAKLLPWRTMVRDPIAYVKGRVRHSDHKTIYLPIWHRVGLNEEAKSTQNTFLD